MREKHTDSLIQTLIHQNEQLTSAIHALLQKKNDIPTIIEASPVPPISPKMDIKDSDKGEKSTLPPASSSPDPHLPSPTQLSSSTPMPSIVSTQIESTENQHRQKKLPFYLAEQNNPSKKRKVNAFAAIEHGQKKLNNPSPTGNYKDRPIYDIVEHVVENSLPVSNQDLGNPLRIKNISAEKLSREKAKNRRALNFITMACRYGKERDLWLSRKSKLLCNSNHHVERREMVKDLGRVVQKRVDKWVASKGTKNQKRKTKTKNYHDVTFGTLRSRLDEYDDKQWKDWLLNSTKSICAKKDDFEEIEYDV